MSKDRKNENNFQHLEGELGKYLERKELDDKKSKSSYLFLMIGFLVLVISGFLYKKSLDTPVETYKDLTSYVESIRQVEAKPFSWTYEEFEALDAQHSAASKTRVEDIIKKYGAPTSLETSIYSSEYESLRLLYQTEQPELLFVDFGGQLTLAAKMSSNLFPEPYEDIVGENSHDWTSQEFNNLRVGASNGEGGVSLDEVLSTYGPVYAAESFGTVDYWTIRIQYLNHETSDNIFLDFTKDGEGEYQLSQKHKEVRNW
ncbi:TPA: hypothetical protein U1344_001937 [Streptococcus suis]|nr:hypothetical protein [Streptococcus suis]HEM4989510.1 hypothetical protein [Streptococcus suis]HEM5206369.1 hypothetical protein [Streptococcus suis]HEM5226873.1 hypothetical protein [Streptococcus suis]HEM5228621.1 hypothetical protein [Streptococcus suis]